MATTTWTAISGDWNDAANWSAGVPGPGDDAVLPASTGYGTITGDGPARSLALATGAAAQLTGRHDLAVLQDGGYLLLDGTAGLTFATATLSGQPGDGGDGVLAVRQGGTLGKGTIVLDRGALEGTLGAISNAVVLASTGTISAVATLLGRISGPGTLVAGEAPFYPGGGLVLTDPGNDYAGGTVVEGGQLVLAATGAAGPGRCWWRATCSWIRAWRRGRLSRGAGRRTPRPGPCRTRGWRWRTRARRSSPRTGRCST